MNFWEELGEAGVGKRDLSPCRGKNVTGQVKTAFFFFLISAQKNTAASLLSVGFSLAGQPRQQQG